jgi:hypothetical protein
MYINSYWTTTFPHLVSMPPCSFWHGVVSLARDCSALDPWHQDRASLLVEWMLISSGDQGSNWAGWCLRVKAQEQTYNEWWSFIIGKLRLKNSDTDFNNVLRLWNLMVGNQPNSNSKVEWQHITCSETWMCSLILKFRGFLKASHDVLSCKYIGIHCLKDLLSQHFNILIVQGSLEIYRFTCRMYFSYQPRSLNNMWISASIAEYVW